MKFEPAPLKDVWIISLDPIRDDRGYFARSFCAKELSQHGIDFPVMQCNVSYNESSGTMRGMHYQCSPREEAKIVRCTHGAIYDVIIDLRSDSPTYLKHFGLELSAHKIRMLYVPRGFAHGFLTLEGKTSVSYMMDESYSPEHACGLRYDDPVLAIEWPTHPVVVSEKDMRGPLLER